MADAVHAEAVPEEVMDQLEDFNKLQERLASSLEACNSALKKTPAAELPPSQRAELFLTQARAIQSLYHMLLRAAGV